jgi:hypothetical protein
VIAVLIARQLRRHTRFATLGTGLHQGDTLLIVHDVQRFAFECDCPCSILAAEDLEAA